MTSQDVAACCAIAQNIANFAFRDEGRWDALRDLFHSHAVIAVSWYRGPIDGFIEASRTMAGPSEVLTKHWFGSPRIQVRGARALSEVDVAIKVRSKIGKLDVDVTSYARFFDRLARFGRYPAEFRHLAFGLERKGLQLADGIVVAHSPKEAALKSAAADWLKA